MRGYLRKLLCQGIGSPAIRPISTCMSESLQGAGGHKNPINFQWIDNKQSPYSISASGSAYFSASHGSFRVISLPRPAAGVLSAKIINPPSI
jgi:hypothetical protein